MAFAVKLDLPSRRKLIFCQLSENNQLSGLRFKLVMSRRKGGLLWSNVHSSVVFEAQKQREGKCPIKPYLSPFASVPSLRFKRMWSQCSVVVLQSHKLYLSRNWAGVRIFRRRRILFWNRATLATFRCLPQLLWFVTTWESHHASQHTSPWYDLRGCLGVKNHLLSELYQVFFLYAYSIRYRELRTQKADPLCWELRAIKDSLFISTE